MYRLVGRPVGAGPLLLRYAITALKTQFRSFQESRFLRRAGTAENPVAMGESSEAANDGAMAFGIIEALLVVGAQRGKKRNRTVLVADVL